MEKKDVFHYLNGCQSSSERDESYEDYIFRRQFLPPHTANEKNHYTKSFPTKEQLQKLKKEKNIDSECFILKPGQLLFIDAGRLHIFRKMGITDIPETDPFYEKRKEHVSRIFAKWNISYAWDFLYIGHQKESLLPLAQLKWFNGVSAAQENIGSLGCIETPLMIILTKYATTKLKKRKTGFFQHMDMLLSALEPLMFTILKYQGDKLPITKETGIGPVVNTTTVPEFKPHLNSLLNAVIDFRCDSCNYHLSNHFLTCRTCLLNEDYMVNICTSCYIMKERSQLFQDIKSKIHKKGMQKKGEMKGGICETCTPPTCNNLELFEDDAMCPKLLNKFYDKKRYQNDYHQIRLNESESCEICQVKCFKCQRGTCSCHNSYELAHLWATEPQIREIFLLNRKNSKRIQLSCYLLF